MTRLSLTPPAGFFALDDFKVHRIIRSYIALVAGAVKQQEE